jgi:hypothetical protein
LKFIFYIRDIINIGFISGPTKLGLDSAEHAMAVRKKRKKKSLDKEVEFHFISNSISVANRVKVDVMKAIARKLTNSDDLAYVAGFTS